MRINKTNDLKNTVMKKYLVFGTFLFCLLFVP